LSLIDRVAAIERDIFAHRYYPLHKIMSDLGGQRLFQTLFNFTNFQVRRVGQ